MTPLPSWIHRPLAVLLCAFAASAADWSGPAPENLPLANVRSEDVAGNVVIVAGAVYRVRISLRPVAILSLDIQGQNLLTESIEPGFVDDQGVRYLPQQTGIPSWQTYEGQSYKPARDVAARLNVWNAGPYYWEAHILDIPLLPEHARSSPDAEASESLNNKVVRGEIVFHTFADRLNIEFRVAPETTGVNPARASWTLRAPGLQHADLGDRKLTRFGPAALLGLPGETYDAKSGRLETPLTAAPDGALRCWWVLRPACAGAPAEELFREELNPLPAANFGIRYGRYAGYDAAAGLHGIEAVTPGLSFNSAYDNPNRRIEIAAAIQGDGFKRRLMCKSISHVGMLPATVLADENGFMLPTPVLACKNFAGEREEPDDSSYGHAFFPLDLAPGEQKRFQILHLFQNWGDHMLKQVSSIRFFHIYWHLSSGVSETTCFTIPWMKLNGVFVLIPDYRPYSGPFWPSQPQHDCQSWPGLLQYRSGNEEVRLIYERTVFESIAPNLALFAMHFTSSDGAARAAATAMEIPQGDQMRTFLKLRYDWHKAAAIDGDARSSFRWLNVNDRSRPRALVYWKESEEAAADAIPPDGCQVIARPLGKTFPFLGTHGMPGNQGATSYSSLALVRSFRARLGGQDAQGPAFSAVYDARGGNYWLTTSHERLTLQPGDFIEAEVMLVPHAEGTEPLVVPVRERRYYGTEGPATAVHTGRKVRDFPATVEAEDEVAALTIKGGTEATPVIAGGFHHWAVPLLWVNGVWQNQQAHGGDGYQVNPDGNGKYRFTFLIKQRQGDARSLIVTRAHCSTGISRTTDRSGYLELTTDAEQGEFSLKAPALFAPGVNTVSADAPVVAFAGTAKTVRQIPLAVKTADQRVTVTVFRCDEKTMDLAVRGAARLEFTALTPAAAYRLLLDGKEQQRRTPLHGRELSVELGAGEHRVVLEKL